MISEEILDSRKQAILLHKGHSLTIVTYGKDEDDVQNIALECETCNEVLWDSESCTGDHQDVPNSIEK